ncbi:MAG: RagB/SusD family nutrient uptake outer membrane protein [Chitinophagaceae bacterium]|jgi:hypothetical protein|nr:RagB/SusD family nutrient uptake outer membrane protein [Chitinophagaceae bacterium]MBP9739665.1 RagB/SusD family nutrient uptake outer membrane protein [Chitinophagaceae bacterium]
MKIQFKNIVSIMLATVTVASMSGCKKYLDQQPITSVGPEFVFKDVSTTYQAIAGAYSRLVGDNGYGIRLSLYYPLDTDEMQGPSGAADNDRRDIARYSATPSNAQLERPFNQLFTGIEYSNICIDNIPKMALFSSGTDLEKKQLQRMYGEALTLRAQYYLEAIRNWGDLPAQFKPAYAEAVANPFPKRVSADSLYDRLLSDLELATTLVPWRNELAAIGDPMDERITKGTVKALRARIALYRGGYRLSQTGTMIRSANYQDFYAIAKKECEEIIASNQHALNPSFKDLWKNKVGGRFSADPHGELMFQASAIGRNATADTKLGYYNGPRVNNLGNSSVNPLPTYFYAFDSTDLRRDVTIAPYNVAADGATKIGLGITAMNDGKFRRDWVSNPPISPTDAVQYLSNKWQIIRYSDVLLMLAEAENEINGPTALAYSLVNQVRRRGYGKSLTAVDATVDLPASLSKIQFFDRLVKERSLELGGEGVRKYDLIRWNLLGTKLAETKLALANMFNRVAPYDTYPTYMYYKQNNTNDDATVWFNSFYTSAPTSTPAGTTRVNWFLNTGSSTINSIIIARLATGYTAGKSELLPIPQPAKDANFNLTQNFGY